MCAFPSKNSFILMAQTNSFSPRVACSVIHLLVNERVALFASLKRNCNASVYMQILSRKALKVAIDLEGRRLSGRLGKWHIFLGACEAKANRNRSRSRLQTLLSLGWGGGGAEPLPLFSQLTRALLTIELTCRLNPALTRTHTAKG